MCGLSSVAEPLLTPTGGWPALGLGVGRRPAGRWAPVCSGAAVPSPLGVQGPTEGGGKWASGQQEVVALRSQQVASRRLILPLGALSSPFRPHEGCHHLGSSPHPCLLSGRRISRRSPATVPAGKKPRPGDRKGDWLEWQSQNQDAGLRSPCPGPSLCSYQAQPTSQQDSSWFPWGMGTEDRSSHPSSLHPLRPSRFQTALYICIALTHPLHPS